MNALTDSLFDPIGFRSGHIMPNRFMLAPLTNLQSHDDGVLSDEEQRWLVMRAEGGFGATMTCAAHVQASGQGFPGQLGIFGDQHVERLTALAARIKAEGSLALVQLHHAGIRSPKELIGRAPVGPSDDDSTGAVALTTEQVHELIEAFVAAAVRAQRAGFDGVELHGAHNYIICAFLSEEFNRRTDEFGGSAVKRARLLIDIIDGIRVRCGSDFVVGVRLSPERFGIALPEMIELAERLFDAQQIDFLDMSLWDSFKQPADEGFQDRMLIEHFTQLDRGDTLLGVAGKLYYPADIRRVVELGADFALLGRAAILQHDFPNRLKTDPAFSPVRPPVTSEYLRTQGLSDTFLGYMSGWAGFIDDTTGNSTDG